jgi:hypothetical protein
MAALTDVFVAVRPDTDNFGKDVTKQLRKIDTKREGRKVGMGFSKSLGSGARVGMGGAARTMFAPVVAAAAAVGGFSLFKTFISEAQESAKIGRLTSQVIKSTGGVANISAKQVGALAESLSNKTAMDDELVQSGANLLLTFKNIRNETGKGNDVFNQATAAALDLSVAGFGSVENTSKQLGKALNDPIKGITALGRAGVTFTEQQKEQIKVLVESGDVLGAQKIILGEVQSQVGGAAKAAADPMERLKVIAGNLGERIGTHLLPYINKAADWLGENLPKALKSAEKWFKSIQPELREFGRWFREEIVPRLKEFATFVQDEVIPRLVKLGGWIGKNKDFFIPFIAALGAGVAAFKAFMFVKNVIVAMKALNLVMRANPIGIVIVAIAALAAGLIMAYKRSKTFRTIVDAVFKAVGNIAKWLWNTFKTGLDWFTRTWNKVWGGLKKIPRQIIAFVVDKFLGLVDLLLKGAAKAFGWIPGLGGKLKKASKNFSTFRKNVNEELSGIKDKKIEVGSTVKINGIKFNAASVAGMQKYLIGNADGNILGKREIHDAQIAPAGAWRVWAEDETGGEAYIPLGMNKRKRSTKLLKSVAEGFGYQMIPAANGMIIHNDIRPYRALKRGYNDKLDKYTKGLASMLDKLFGSAPGTAGALRWAKTQVGKPYLWGGVGPGGYDCSGFLSAIVNKIQGKPPYSRRFTSGSLPAGMFSPGYQGSGFNVGWFRGAPGHVAGTLAGTNVESSGGVGVRVGSSARGARSGMFNGAWHLKSYDTGNWMPPGLSLAYNGTGRAEHLTPGGGVHFHFHGPVASKQGAQDMVLGAYTQLVRERKITP